MMFLTLCVLIGGVTGYAVDDIQGKVVIKDSFPTTMDNIEFGSGYNSITLKRTYNTAVDVDRAELPQGGFIEINFKIKLCKSREEFFQSFSGGISASGSYMGVEGSASVKFLTETKITSLDSVLIASVDAITDTQISTNARFNELSKKILASGDYAGFTEKYGTHYLRKVILGGKMMLVMKFSSTSKEVKKELDSKLSVSTGTFGAEAEFAAKMSNIREKSSLEVSLYAAGGDVAPPKPSVEEGIEYAVEFAKSILDHPAVREVEFAASWTIPGAPSAFRSYLFPEQGKTDSLVHIAVGLLNAQSQLEDMQAMRLNEMSYISETGWSTVKTLRGKAVQYRLGLQAQFRTHHSADFQNIIAEFEGKDKEVITGLDQLLAAEQKYDSTKKMYMKSAGTGLFISTRDGKYPRLDPSAPIPLWMQDVGGNKNIFFGGSHYVFIGSETQPGQFICMVSNNYYGQWVSKSDAGSNCHWRLAHSTSYNKRDLEFGDRIILFNRKWTDYILGVSDNGKWIEDVKAGESSDRKNQWIVDKTQF